VGCSVQAIRKYEAGTRTPRLEQLLRVCRTLSLEGQAGTAQDLALEALRSQIQA